MGTFYVDNILGTYYVVVVHIISRKKIKEFWETSKYADSEEPLRAWFHEASTALWKTPAELKEKYGNASIIDNKRVVFNIHGNKYRLVVWINYDFNRIYIRFIGTHEEYDKIDLREV